MRADNKRDISGMATVSLGPQVQSASYFRGGQVEELTEIIPVYTISVEPGVRE